MSELINMFLSEYSLKMWLAQSGTVFVLFLLGLFVVFLLNNGRIGFFEYLLAYPVGLSVFTIWGFFNLLFSIPYRITVIAVEILIFIAVLLLAFHKKMAFYINLKHLAYACLIALALALLSTAGLFSVSISNDSMYYYSMFPRALVKSGKYHRELNVFLTDVGQGSAVIGSLPYMLGFDESFGIQTFFNINVLLLFANALFEYAKDRLEKKKAYTIALILVLLLISSMPVILVSKWAMSNGYFCGYMFLVVYYIRKYFANSNDYLKEEVNINGICIIGGMLLLTLSLLRMEGFIIALFITVVCSTLNISNKILFFGMLLPELIVSVIYDLRILIFMDIDAPYTFLTREKAMLQLAAYIFVGLYLLLVRGRFFLKLQAGLNLLIPATFILVNAILFVYDRSLYVMNIKAFLANLLHSSGWGIYPIVVVGIYIICIVSGGIRNFKYNFYDLCFIGYLLITLAVCFARDGAMKESVGDSGNRVLLQGVLIYSFATFSHVVDLFIDNETNQ